jgi:hypothetical protein
MRSILRTGLTALAAVLALAAVAVSPALAAREWYVKKGGTYSKVTTAVNVRFEASKVAMIRNEGGAYSGLSCTSSNFGHGTVESGGLGKIEQFETANPQLLCRGGKIKENTEVNFCEEKGIESTSTIHLPWKTELTQEGTATRASIASSGAGTPGFFAKCTGGFGKIQFECGVNTSAHMANNVTAGLVEAEFDTKSAKTGCGKANEAGEWKGILKVKPTEAEKTAGVEAIKVE